MKHLLIQKLWGSDKQSDKQTDEQKQLTRRHLASLDEFNQSYGFL